jgi:hypothetical protein
LSADYKVLAFKAARNTVGFWEADSGKVLPPVTLQGWKRDFLALAWLEGW